MVSHLGLLLLQVMVRVRQGAGVVRPVDVLVLLLLVVQLLLLLLGQLVVCGRWTQEGQLLFRPATGTHARGVGSGGGRAKSGREVGRLWRCVAEPGCAQAQKNMVAVNYNWSQGSTCTRRTFPFRWCRTRCRTNRGTAFRLATCWSVKS